MREKKYILLKDIPLYKAGTVFVRRFAGSPIYSPIGRSYPIYSERQILSMHGEWFIEDQTELVNAMKVVCRELREDGKGGGSYYGSWKDNIAMQFKDEFARWYKKEFGVDFGDDDEAVEVIHEIANNSARNFLDLLIRE